MRLIALAVAAAISLPAHAALAFLYRSETGTSVTGKPVWICIYDYAGKKFKRVIPLADGPCPVSIEIE